METINDLVFCAGFLLRHLCFFASFAEIVIAEKSLHIFVAIFKRSRDNGIRAVFLRACGKYFCAATRADDCGWLCGRVASVCACVDERAFFVWRKNVFKKNDRLRACACRRGCGFGIIYNYGNDMENIANKTGGFDKFAFEQLFEKEEKSFWFTSRNKLIIYFLKKYFDCMKDYIEIGCGTGFVLKAVAENFPCCNVTGSELFEEGLVYAKQRVPNANLIQLDSAKMTEKEQYDVFGAFDVLEHIKEDDLVMRNLFKSLKTTGYPESCGKLTHVIYGGGVITVPQHMFMWSVADEEACHVRRYSQKELRAKLEAAGFKVKRITGFVSLLFPFMMVSRFFANKKKKQSDELSLPFWLNMIFSAVMEIEFFLLRLGINFPFGGSIIVVVAK